MLQSIQALIITLTLTAFTFADNLLNVDFETDGSGYSASATEGEGHTDVFNRTNPDLGGNATYMWSFEDLAIEDPTLTLDQIDVSGQNSFSFALDLLAHHYNDWDGGSQGDNIKIYYSLDGGDWQNLMWILALYGQSGAEANEPAALDTDFDGVAECDHVLPSLSLGTGELGCEVTANTFQTFTTSDISLNGASTLDIKLEFLNFTSNDEGGYIDNIVVSGESSGGSGCTSDADCDDSDDYTVDSCGTDGLCSYVTLDCLTDDDCDDSNSCTTSTCGTDNTCSTENLANDSDCDDGDGWTSGDVCTDGTCAGSALPTVNVTFNLDLNIEGANSPQVRVAYGCLAGCDGEHDGSVDQWLNNSWENMTDDDGDGVWSYTMALATGVDYNYSYKNGGYESPADTETCFGDPYGNARHVVPGDTDMDLSSVCWNSCDACPVNDIEGCTESSACNYNSEATISTDTCLYLDCAAECGGDAVNDACGVCNGDGSSCSTSYYDWEDGGTILGSYGNLGSATVATATDDGTAPSLNNNLLRLVEDPNSGTPQAYLAYVQNLSNGDHVTACFSAYDVTPGASPSLRIWGAYLDAAGSYAGSAGGNNDYSAGTGWSELCQTWTVDFADNVDDDPNTTEVDESADNRTGLNIHARLYSGTDLNVHYVDDLSVVAPIAATVQFPPAPAEECTMGDVNGDDSVNVLDVVAIVSYVVSGGSDIDAACADVNGDGVVNVLDVVAIVSDIVGGRFDDAPSAKLIKSTNGLTLKAEGYIGGVQMTLRHGDDFTIKLSENAWISDYATSDRQTILVLVHPAEGELFTTNINFEIVDMIVANSQGEINTTIATEFSISDAYPNPFNPTTTVELTLPEAGHISVMVYNIAGQLVAELADSYMDANQYQFIWQGENVPSGMYLLRAEYAGQVSTQKLMLLK